MCPPLSDLWRRDPRVDYSKPVSDEVFDEIKAPVGKYGVVVLRNTGLSDWTT